MSQTHNGSFIAIPANEVKRLCLETISFIKTKREQYKREIIEQYKNDQCTHFFGLFSHPRYSSEDEILNSTLEGALIRDWARHDLAAAEKLLRAANWVLENDQAQKILVGVDDLRAISCS
jgi:hypothetical protein